MNATNPPSPRRAALPRRRVGACLVALLCAGLQHRALAAQELTELSLEQLLDVPIVSASKFAQKVSEAPSAVTVITRDDIRQYGWRTVSEVLRSVRGFFVHYDRAYEYVGVRGFARPQDYNSRLLLLIDGYRTNDPLYDMAYVGTDAVLDLDLVDRIEIVRGPGSSVYGGNALFGVINIVTRGAAQIDGVELGARYSSFNTREGRATLGKRFDNGAELVASVSGMDSAGPDLFFPEFDAPETNFGRTTGTDYARNGRFFARLSQEGLSVTAAASRREKGNPSGAFGGLFNDPTSGTMDSQAFVDVGYYRDLSAETQLSGRVFWADYAYHGPTLFPGDEDVPPILNHDNGRGTWWGAEAKVVTDLSPRNKLVAGIEYQRNYRQNQSNYDDDPYFLYFDDRRRSERAGIFAQDEFQWTDALKLSLGARYDKVTAQQGQVSPRLGLIYRSSEQTVWKLLYGSAFRAPNVYESFYIFPELQKANPALQPERIKTYEAGIEHYLAKQTRLLATVYVYRIENLIEQVEAEDELLQFQNVGAVTARGLELEAEHQWNNGARLRASLELQRTRDVQGAQLTNSPRAMAKMNFSTPLPWGSLRLGAEGQWLSSRKTDVGTVPAYGVANLTLLRPLAKDGWEVSASVFNLFDRRYADPVAPDVAVQSRDRMEQDGRTFRIKVVHRF
jgi:iron complex outermembrane receptor protein